MSEAYEKLANRMLQSFIFGFLLIVSSCTAAFADEEIVSREQPQLSDVALKSLRKLSSVEAERLSAIQELSAQASVDLLVTLLERLENELISDNPAVEVVKAILLIFKKTANDDFISDIQTYRGYLHDRKLKISKVQGRAQLFSQFDNAIQAMKLRKEVTPTASVASHEVSLQPQPLFLFKEYLLKAVDDAKKSHAPRPRTPHEKIPAFPEELVSIVMATALTDEARLQRQAGEHIRFQGRDDVANTVLDVLIRSKAKNPVLVGPSGVGKTAVANVIAEMVLDKTYPRTKVFSDELLGAEVIVTTPARISQMALSNEATAQAAAMELFFNAVRQVEVNYEKRTGKKKPIIVLLDDMHTLDPPQMHALKQILEDSIHPIHVIGASQKEALDLKIKKAPALQKLLELIPVREFSETKTIEILKETWIPIYEAKYNVRFDDRALSTVLRVSTYLKPGLARPEAPSMVLQSIAIKAHRDHLGQSVLIDDDDVYEYARTVTGIPTNPHKADELVEYLDRLTAKLEAKVANQRRMIDAIVDLWSQVLTGDPHLPKAILFSGPTGTGKTLVSENFALEAFGDKNRVFKLDGTLLQDGKFALGAIFGVPTGVQGSDVSSGTLMEWLDDPARGQMGGVIVINEAEKMHPDAWRRLMEFMSEGVVYGGDGRPRYANRHLLVFTSNKGTREIFPDSVLSWSQDEIDARINQISEADIKNYFLTPDPEKEEFVLPREILGRIHRAVVANPVTPEVATEIGLKEVEKYVQMQQEIYHVKIKVDEKLIGYLSVTGLNALEGARPIHNQISTYINQAMKKARKTWDIERDAEVQLKLIENGPGTPVEIEVSFHDQSFRIEAPQKPTNNPLLRSEVREMIHRLPEVMHGHMVEQPEAVDEIITAIRAKFGDASRKQPMSTTLVGTTGVGKTEMGRAIGLALYKSTERVSVIPLGEMHKNKDLEVVFGSPGSKQMWLFENALISNPQGGVIIFDEFSNMGGADLAMKDALIKRFYTLIEEGFWVSPRDGHVYDLRNYFFLFTGNDLEPELQGVSSDEQRLYIYNQIRNREKVQALLRRNGVPEAFLARQDVVAILKPLVSKAKSRVTRKLLEEWVTRFEKQHEGVRIEYDEEFVQKLARAYFSHDRGARSVRSAVQNGISGLATDSLLKTGYNPAELNGMVLKLSIEDNLPDTKAYIDSGEWTRQVEITCEIVKNGETLLSNTVDTSDTAAKTVVLSKSEALLGAYREAGKFVVNKPELTELRMTYVTIRGHLIDGDRKMGYSRYESPNGATRHITRKKAVALMATYWAGRLAQEKAGFDADTQWEHDLASLRATAMNLLIKFGLNDGLETVRVNEFGEPQLNREQRAEFDDQLKKLFAESKEAALADLEANWPQVQSMVNLLMEKSELTYAQIQELDATKAATCASLLQ